MKRLCSIAVLAASVAIALGAPPRKQEADPAATKLLAGARAARATWKDFPGFTAELAVNVEGKVSRGRVEVGADGKVRLDLPGASAAAETWARHTLGSVVGHRLDGGAGAETPCAFADDVTTHPLGRAIRVLNDEYHSSYRIRDRQVVVVNRTAGPVRFTITVLENLTNRDKHFLPRCFVVNTWDVQGGALKKSEAHHQTWQRVGSFDLPTGVTVVAAAADGQQTRSLRLSNYHLAENKKR